MIAIALTSSPVSAAKAMSLERELALGAVARAAGAGAHRLQMSRRQQLDLALTLTSSLASAATAMSLSNEASHMTPLRGQSEQAILAGLSGRRRLDWRSCIHPRPQASPPRCPSRTVKPLLRKTSSAAIPRRRKHPRTAEALDEVADLSSLPSQTEDLRIARKHEVDAQVRHKGSYGTP
jgi:hypothetical protein